MALWFSDSMVKKKKKCFPTNITLSLKRGLVTLVKVHCFFFFFFKWSVFPKGHSSKQEANIFFLSHLSLIPYQQLKSNFTMPLQSNTDWDKIQEEKTFMLKRPHYIDKNVGILRKCEQNQPTTKTPGKYLKMA